MPDFSSLTTKIAGTSVKPKVLVPGDYLSVITGHSLVEAPKGKDYKTIIRLALKPIEWPEDTEQDDKMQDGPEGRELIDLSKRTLRRDYYDHRLYDFDQLLEQLGIELGRPYAEVFPELVGKQVWAEVTQYANQQTGEFANQVNNLRGA